MIVTWEKREDDELGVFEIVRRKRWGGCWKQDQKPDKPPKIPLLVNVESFTLTPRFSLWNSVDKINAKKSFYF